MYSYGVILLELLTGRKPVNPSCSDATDLVAWVHSTSSRDETPEQVNSEHSWPHVKPIVKLSCLLTVAYYLGFLLEISIHIFVRATQTQRGNNACLQWKS